MNGAYITTTVLTAIFSLIFIWSDGVDIKAGYHIKAGHNPRFVMRVFCIAMFVAVTHVNITDISLLTIHQGVIFWIIFDYGLNIYRRRSFFYVGKTAGLDRFFGKRIHFARIIALIFSYGVYAHLDV